MKKIHIKTLAAAVLFAAVAVFGWTAEAFAAGRAIALSPTSQRIVLIPGETYRGGFSVVNPAGSESDLNYLVTVASFSQSGAINSKDDYGEVDFDTKTDANSIVDWTTLANPTGVVAPNDEEVVSYIIDVPEDAPAGGQYMALLVRENPEFQNLNDGSMGVNEVMQMAFVVYAEVAGETVKTGEILENNVPAFLFNNELNATSLVRNGGNIHTDASYVLQVWPMFSDEEVCTNEENPTTEFLMPDTRRYHTETCKLPAVGLFRAKQTVSIFGETSVVEKTIIVCPLWMLFVIVFIVVALIVWAVTMRKKRRG